MFSAYQAFKFLTYKLHAVNQHALHSPFVYNLYNQVLKSTSHHPVFSEIELFRTQLLNNNNKIEIKDFGAGSRVTSATQRKIGAIAKSALSSNRFSEMMFNLCQFTRAQNIVELGTSFGINTIYLSKANNLANVMTFEGCPETLKIASEIFSLAGLTNIAMVEGDIDQSLDSKLAATAPIDLVYMDANHRYAATMRYFNCLIPHLSSKAVVIVDDIYWSREMNQAWNALVAMKEVTLSVDIFDAGLLFFDKSLSKEHFVIDF